MKSHRYHVSVGSIKAKSHNAGKRAMALIAAIVLGAGIAYPLRTNAEASVSASISVNGERSGVVGYGTDVTLTWVSSGMDECTVTPGNWSGLEGTRILEDVTDKQTYKLACKGSKGTATSYTTFAVYPPTFHYLANFFVDRQRAGGTNTGLVQGVSQQIRQAKSFYESGRYDDAKKFLDQTVSKVRKMAAQEKLPASDAGEYTAAVGALQTSLVAYPPLVEPDMIPSDEVTLINPDVNVPGTGVSCGGGYPARWCEQPHSTILDSWGFYNREAVSYAAFKVHQDFLAEKNKGDMPYWGNVASTARDWDDSARRSGIPVDRIPLPGAIAISNTGNYGHAMYVEEVGTMNGQPAIYVSQYNAVWDGRYSEGWRYVSDLVFIHF